MPSRWCTMARASSLRSASRRCPPPSGSARSSSSPAIATSSATPAPGTSTCVDDLRIKMCIDITAEDFITIHHELGHNFYQRAYNKQPILFRDSANDGFHEAIGDTIALSVTPEYLVKIGLLDKAPDTSERHRPAAAQSARKDRLPALRPADRQVALEGLLRRDHAGAVQQGVVGPAAEVSGSCPAARAHAKPISIPAPSITSPPTSLTRATSSPTFSSSSFTARSRRRGLHGAAQSLLDLRQQGGGRAAERDAGDGRRAGRGRKRLAALTGSRQMDATAILDYFAPLQKWLDEQNKGKPVGW